MNPGNTAFSDSSTAPVLPWAVRNNLPCQLSRSSCLRENASRVLESSSTGSPKRLGERAADVGDIVTEAGGHGSALLLHLRQALLAQLLGLIADLLGEQIAQAGIGRDRIG